MSDLHDHLVIGAGPLGSATARHLAERGEDVVVVGPEEPAGFADHDGVWAGYYDQGRLGHVLEVPLLTCVMAARSMRRFAELSERSGVDFAQPVHSVWVMPQSTEGGRASEWFDRARLAENARDLGVEVSLLDEDALRSQYPGITLEAGHVGVVQPDARIVNPRALVRAELSLAVDAGATLVRDVVLDVDDRDATILATTSQGRSLRARGAILATGAASNATGLLPRRLDIETLGATVVLVEVEGPHAVEMPAMMYLKQRAGELLFGGIVMSPLRYPDGRWYVKVSGTSVSSNPLDSADEIAAWVRTGGRREDIDEAMGMVRELLPGLEPLSVHTRPCLVCETPTQLPYVDHVDGNKVIVVEGSRGVMAADELGRLAGGLALTGRWTDSLPKEMFRARWRAAGSSGASASQPA